LSHGCAGAGSAGLAGSMLEPLSPDSPPAAVHATSTNAQSPFATQLLSAESVPPALCPEHVTEPPLKPLWHWWLQGSPTARASHTFSGCAIMLFPTQSGSGPFAQACPAAPPISPSEKTPRHLQTIAVRALIGASGSLRPKAAPPHPARPAPGALGEPGQCPERPPPSAAPRSPPPEAK